MVTYKVTTDADAGQGSLRQAILDANANPGLDTIVFEIINVNLNSAILISDSLEITGNGAVITQTGSDRLFNISDGSDETFIDVTLNNLTLTGGNANQFGGAINNVENLTISQITFENNLTSQRGAAVFSSGGNLLINDSAFRNNSLSDDSVSSGGGIVYISGGTLQFQDSSLEENDATLGVIRASNSEVTISDSSILNNQGLGIFADNESIVNISESDLSNNSGGITITTNSQLNLDRTSIINNQTQLGAGIAITESSQAEIVDSIISNNTATISGGGINAEGNSQLTVENSTIMGNIAPIGSAIYLSDDSEGSLLDTTVAENTESDKELEGDISVETTPVILPDEANFSFADVHRFYQYEKGFHLYTSDINEIAAIQEQSEAGTLSYNYEAEKFTVLESDRDSITGAIIEGAKPVYRFFNINTGSHLYTMDEIERGFIDENLDNYNFEGIKYYAFEEKPENLETLPVYRMLNGQSGSHLFTVDRVEVDNIQQNLPHFSLEGDDGIAFHVFELQ
ncbi:MAG: right-handed parallel beta-helix repeat-containing protein [Pleurocapsa sp. MO_226.B13]|nr:right-handed parallel beta-helix repeat-containing protein [Pleurocapsa sp. MO_226.B13]